MPHSRSISPLGFISTAPTLHSLVSPSGPISTTVSATDTSLCNTLEGSPSARLADLAEADVGDRCAGGGSGSSVMSRDLQRHIESESEGDEGEQI